MLMLKFRRMAPRTDNSQEISYHSPLIDRPGTTAPGDPQSEIKTPGNLQQEARHRTRACRWNALTPVIDCNGTAKL